MATAAKAVLQYDHFRKHFSRRCSLARGDASCIQTGRQMRVKGKVIKWQNDKGFGFIEPVNGMPDIFFHENFLLHHSRRPIVGDEVSFEIATTPEGRQRAERIVFRGDHDPRQRDKFFDIFYSGLSNAFLIGIGILVFYKKLDPILGALYWLFSLVTFLLYRRDKNKARKDEWRTPEMHLHFFSLIGGWPGALIAQRALHHKSRKTSFLIIFSFTVVLNILALSYYCISESKFLRYDAVLQTFNQLTRKIPHNFSDKPEQRSKGPVYSWINKDGKKVYSNVGFPTNEPYSDGKIEWK